MHYLFCYYIYIKYFANIIFLYRTNTYSKISVTFYLCVYIYMKRLNIFKLSWYIHRKLSKKQTDSPFQIMNKKFFLLSVIQPKTVRNLSINTENSCLPKRCLRYSTWNSESSWVFTFLFGTASEFEYLLMSQKSSIIY